MRLGTAVNQYGTPVSVHRCDKCNRSFTVCPALDVDDDCLSFDCPSYDVERDVDLMFEIEPWRITRVHVGEPG